MAEEIYGRGQVEWALWCSFARARFNPGDVPQIFRTRIKRLLEIDLYATSPGVRTFSLGEVHLRSGRNGLTFRLAGKSMGLDYFRLD